MTATRRWLPPAEALALGALLAMWRVASQPSDVAPGAALAGVGSDVAAAAAWALVLPRWSPRSGRLAVALLAAGVGAARAVGAAVVQVHGVPLSRALWVEIVRDGELLWSMRWLLVAGAACGPAAWWLGGRLLRADHGAGDTRAPALAWLAAALALAALGGAATAAEVEALVGTLTLFPAAGTTAASRP